MIDHSVFHSASNAYILHHSSKHKSGSTKGILTFFLCFTADYGWRAAEQCGDTEAAA